MARNWIPFSFIKIGRFMVLIKCVNSWWIGIFIPKMLAAIFILAAILLWMCWLYDLGLIINAKTVFLRNRYPSFKGEKDWNSLSGCQKSMRISNYCKNITIQIYLLLYSIKKIRFSINLCSFWTYTRNKYSYRILDLTTHPLLYMIQVVPSYSPVNMWKNLVSV